MFYYSIINKNASKNLLYSDDIFIIKMAALKCNNSVTKKHNEFVMKTCVFLKFSILYT